MIWHKVWSLLRDVSDATQLDRNRGCNRLFHVRPFFSLQSFCVPRLFLMPATYCYVDSLTFILQ